MLLCQLHKTVTVQTTMDQMQRTWVTLTRSCLEGGRGTPRRNPPLPNTAKEAATEVIAICIPVRLKARALALIGVLPMQLSWRIGARGGGVIYTVISAKSVS